MRAEKQAVKRTLGETLKAHRTRHMTQEFEAESFRRQPPDGLQMGERQRRPSTTNLLALAKLYGVAAEEPLRGMIVVKSEESNLGAASLTPTDCRGKGFDSPSGPRGLGQLPTL